MGAGFIPVPIADVFAISAVQLDMIRQLCNLYDVNYKETESKAVISALTGSVLARLGARAVKFIPGVGSVIGGVSLAVLSGASTYALGEAFRTHFETGGTFLDFDMARLKRAYDELFEKGKDYARQVRKEGATIDHPEAPTSKSGETVQTPVGAELRELAQLHKDGLLTDEEYQMLKRKWLESQ